MAVGTQFPFDRLIRTVDAWAESRNRTDVVAQVGQSSYQPRAIRAFPFLDMHEFRQLQEQAQLFIAHAGMGSILTAMELGKPVIIMPRDHRRGEHRNGHQMATALRFAGRAGIQVAMTEDELAEQLDTFVSSPVGAMASKEAPAAFTQQLARFIEDDAKTLGFRWLKRERLLREDPANDTR